MSRRLREGTFRPLPYLVIRGCLLVGALLFAGCAPPPGTNLLRGTARVLVDVRNSFAPYDAAKTKQIRTAFDAVAQHITQNWPLGGTMSVHVIDENGVTSQPPCPATEYTSGGLLNRDSVDLHKFAEICADQVAMRAKSPAQASDLTNAINTVATFDSRRDASNVFVVISDFQEESRQKVRLESLAGVNVVLVYGPEKRATNSNDFLERVRGWQQKLLDAGAPTVNLIPLMNLTRSQLMSLLPGAAPVQ